MFKLIIAVLEAIDNARWARLERKQAKLKAQAVAKAEKKAPQLEARIEEIDTRLEMLRERITENGVELTPEEIGKRGKAISDQYGIVHWKQHRKMVKNHQRRFTYGAYQIHDLIRQQIAERHLHQEELNNYRADLANPEGIWTPLSHKFDNRVFH